MPQGASLDSPVLPHSPTPLIKEAIMGPSLAYGGFVTNATLSAPSSVFMFFWFASGEKGA